MDDLFESLSKLQGWDQVVPSVPSSKHDVFKNALIKHGIDVDTANRLMTDPEIIQLLNLQSSQPNQPSQQPKEKKHKIKFDQASSIHLEEQESTHKSLGTFQSWTDVTGTGPPAAGTKGALQAVNFTFATEAIKSLEERVLAWQSFTTAQIEILEMAKSEMTQYSLLNSVSAEKVPMTSRMIYCMDSALMLQHKCAALISSITGSLYIPMRIHIHMVNPAHESCHAAFINLFSAMDVAAKEALRAAHHAGMAAQSRGTGGNTPNEIVELLGALRVQYLHSLMVNGKYALSRHDWRRTYLLQETMLSWENLLSNSAMAIGSRITQSGIASLESFGLQPQEQILKNDISGLAKNILFSSTSLGESGGGDCAWPNMASTGRVTETASIGSQFAQNCLHNIKLMAVVDQEHIIKDILEKAKVKLNSATRLYNKFTLNSEQRALDRYTSAINADIARSRSDTVFLALGDARATATEDQHGRLQITGIYDPRMLNRSKLPILERKNIYKLLIEDEYQYGTPISDFTHLQNLDKVSTQFKERCLVIGEKARTYPGRASVSFSLPPVSEQYVVTDFDINAICEAAAAAAAAATTSYEQAQPLEDGQHEQETTTEYTEQLTTTQIKPTKKRKIVSLSDAMNMDLQPTTSSKLSYAQKIKNIKESDSFKKLQSGEYNFNVDISERQQRKYDDEIMKNVRQQTLTEVEQRILQLKADTEEEITRIQETKLRKELYDIVFEEKYQFIKAFDVDFAS
jgi:hypothetical protein